MRLNNARLVLPDEVVLGCIESKNGVISAIDSGASNVGEDLQQDYLFPGFVELHTDNAERHILPRPSVLWPNPLAAVLTHDAELSTSGITTVFDSLRVGEVPGEQLPDKAASRSALFNDMVNAIVRGCELKLFRCRHQLHFRCELTDADLLPAVQAVVTTPGLGLVSLMDHTPGQRQWRNLDALRTFSTRTQKTSDEIDQMIDHRISVGQQYVVANRQHILALFRQHQVVFASHDDTTEEHVAQAISEGIRIAEFPCTLEAAKAAVHQGMATLGGAPNLVRGGSHSGNVAVATLAQEGVLSGLSSDYVPASLLQAVFQLVWQMGWSLPSATRLVTQHPADMVGMSDRGRLKIGCMADFVHVRVIGNTPVIIAVYVAGKRVS